MVGVFAGEDEVDERQNQKPMDGMAQQTAQDVFAKDGEELPHILHLNDLAGHQEQDAHRSIPSHQGDRCLQWPGISAPY